MATIGVYYDKLLEDVNIRYPTKYPAKLLFENYNFYKKFYENSNRRLQKGGSKYKDYNYNDCTVRVYTRKEDDRHVYAIHNNDDDENTQECMLIFIAKDNNKMPFAYIENISAYDNCYKCASMKTKTGTFLLTFMLNLIKNKLKDKYKLKYIQLRDNSIYHCKLSDATIKFSAFYMLTRGDTWYGKYGFVPFDDEKLKADKEYAAIYMKNKQIVNDIKVQQVNMLKLIYTAIIKLKMTDKYTKKYISEIIEPNKNKSIKDFLYLFTKKLDKTCAIFSSFYEELMNDLHMQKMHGWTYYMPLD